FGHDQGALKLVENFGTPAIFVPEKLARDFVQARGQPRRKLFGIGTRIFAVDRTHRIDVLVDQFKRDAAVSVAYSITPSYSFSSAPVMRSRVRGKSRMRAPSAWETALPIAAAVGPAVTSPTPSGTSSFVLINSISISGTSLNFITG